MGIISKIKSFKRCYLPTRSDLGTAGKNAKIEFPVYITKSMFVHMEENTVLRQRTMILNDVNEHVYIKKYTVIAPGCKIVTNNHRSTVGIPHVLLGASHINDKSRDIIINEDVWVGVNVTILSGAEIGRGCVVGACSMVNKPIPPYAVVVGSPAKIVGVKFSVEQILKHEEALYPPEERMSRNELEELFATYYEGKTPFGVETEFTADNVEHFNWAVRKRRFIHPKHGKIKIQATK